MWATTRTTSPSMPASTAPSRTTRSTCPCCASVTTKDNVSVAYVLPADKTATVKVGSTTVVEMHNVLRDTLKTGDNSNVGLWTVLAGLSALGIVGTAVVAYRKK